MPWLYHEKTYHVRYPGHTTLLNTLHAYFSILWQTFRFLETLWRKLVIRVICPMPAMDTLTLDWLSLVYNGN